MTDLLEAGEFIQRALGQTGDQLLRAPPWQGKMSGSGVPREPVGLADATSMPLLLLVNLPIKPSLPYGVWVTRNGTNLTDLPEGQTQIEPYH